MSGGSPLAFAAATALLAVVLGGRGEEHGAHGHRLTPWSRPLLMIMTRGEARARTAGVHT